MTRSIDIAVVDLEPTPRACIPKPSSAVKMLTSSTTEKIAGVEVFLTEGRPSELPGSSFMTLVAFAIASTPETARTIPTKPFQLCQNPSESGFTLCQASPKCGNEKNARTTTVITVGTETATANSPVRFGPKKFNAPIPRIATPAKISGCGTPTYWNPDRALIDAVTM
jgi:hypothetical protein